MRLGTWKHALRPSIIGPSRIYVHPAGFCNTVSFPDGTQGAIEAMHDEPVRILIAPDTCDGWAAESLGERSIPPLTIAEVRSRREYEAMAGSITGLLILALGLCIGWMAVAVYRSSLDQPSDD